MLRALWIVMALCASSSAWARPAEKVLLLAVGEQGLVTGPPGSWRIFVSRPEVAEARMLEATAEVLVKGLAEGECSLILHNPAVQSATVWSVRVGKQRPELRRPDPGLVRQACKCQDDEKVWLNCLADSAECLDALSLYLAGADLQGEELSLRFELETLQLLLQRMQKALAEAKLPGVELGFLGGSLVVDGLVADEAAWRKMMLVIHEQMLGRLSLTDRVRRLKVEPDEKP